MIRDVKLGISLGLGLLLIVMVGAGSFLGIQKVAESNRQVTHTQEVLANLEHILSLLKDAETGQRGFVLTGEERYLEPFTTAAGEVGKSSDTLARLTRDNPAQQQDLRLLSRLSGEKFAELELTISLRRQGSLPKALAVIRSDRGKRLMDQIRSVVGLMEAREWQLLQRRNQVADAAALQNSVLVGLGMLLSLTGLTIAAVVMVRSMRAAETDPTPAGNGGRTKIALRYLFAIAMVGLAMLGRRLLANAFGPMPPFIIFYPTILLVATITGGGPGILATILSVLAADYWYFQPVGQFSISSPSEAISLGIFGSASMFLSVLAERMHRARISEAVSITQESELLLLDMGNLMTLDPERRILRWSQGCSRLYGFSADEAKGRLVDELLETRIEGSWDKIQRSLNEGGYWEGEITRCSKSGTRLHLTILLALRRDRQGRPSAMLEVSTDLTTQKTVEAELQDHKAHLQSLNEELKESNERLQAQAEELQAQAEELQTQGEELQSQTEELHAQNQELKVLWDESRQTKEALDKSQERLLLALNSARMGTFEWDIVNDRRHFDDNVHRLLRTNPLTFTGTAEEFFQVLHPDDRGAVQSALAKALAAGFGYHTEYRVVWPDGSFHHIAARGTVHRDQDGRPEHLTGVCWDVTEVKEAEALLSENRELLRLFIEHAPAALAMFDSDMRYLSVSRRWLSDYQLGERDLAGLSHYEILPEISDTWKEFHRRALSGEVVRSDADRFERADGSVQWLRWEIRPWHDVGGTIGGIVIFAEDITKQQMAEEALKKLNEELELRIAQRTEELAGSLDRLGKEVTERQMSEERLRLLIDGARDYAIIMLDVDGCVVSWNEGARRLKGWSEQEILGRHFSLFYPEESIAAGNPEHELELAASFGRFSEEGWRVRKDGSRFLAEVIITAVHDQSGKLRGYSKITRDITERREAEERIQATMKELERSNRELEQFAYVASHDLQEPLRMVASYTQLLAKRYEGALDEQATKFIDYAVDGAVRMQRLINDLLAYSRVSTQGKELASVAAQAAVDEALKDLASSIEENRASVTCDRLPPVRADAAQLRQLFQNLVSNAIKFKGDDPPAIHIFARDLGSAWRFSVMDNGIGIETQYADKIFVIFQRLHTRQEYPGTGIGLAICKRIVERHGGTIWFESEPGQGSTFNFTMPK